MLQNFFLIYIRASALLWHEIFLIEANYARITNIYLRNNIKKKSSVLVVSWDSLGY